MELQKIEKPGSQQKSTVNKSTILEKRGVRCNTAITIEDEPILAYAKIVKECFLYIVEHNENEVQWSQYILVTSCQWVGFLRLKSNSFWMSKCADFDIIDRLFSCDN